MSKKWLCLLLSAFLVLGGGLNAWATSSGEVLKKQSETKNQLNEVNKSITAIEKKRKEVQSQISSLNEELVETMLTLEALETDLEIKQGEIEEAQAEYDRLKQLEEEQYEAMKLRIQHMYEQGSDDYVSLFLSAESISDLLNRVELTKGVLDYDDAKMKEYQETKDQAAETKAVLEEEQAELEEVQEAQKTYKADLDKKISSARAKQSNFESELASAKKKAEEYTKTIKEQTALIKKLEAEEAEKSSVNGSSEESSSSGTSSSGGGSSASVSGSGLGAEIAAYALKFVGNPYVSGGTSLTNGADCSGFTWAVHQHFGISIPRRSVDQAGSGKSISIGAVQVGDIIYYGNHVGIYIGNGRIVHASTQSTGIKISSYTYRTPICVRRYW